MTEEATSTSVHKDEGGNEGRSYAKSIDLPPLEVFKNMHTVKRFAVDIGGSLAKIVYMSEVEHKRRRAYSKCPAPSGPVEVEEGESCDAKPHIEEHVESCDRLHFVKFETKYIDECLNFIGDYLLTQGCSLTNNKIKITGGGALKYRDVLKEKLGVSVEKLDEMQCLIDGCNFLLKHIPNECFQYVKSEFVFQNLICEEVFPYLLVNIGSGVSIIKVEGPDKFERIGGTSTGGGTFWGLGSLLTEAKGFDELLDMTLEGKTKNIDMLVKDIYGGAYSEMNLPGDLVASSFGKASRASKDGVDGASTLKERFRQEDIAKALLRMISNDIGQISSLYAQVHGLTRIIFGGYFIRGHPVTMDTISYAINFFSKGKQQALFLRHEGYLGAIGAFVNFPKSTINGTSSWHENLALSSFPADPMKRVTSPSFDMFQLDRIKLTFKPCPLLLNPPLYEPDLIDLIIDEDSREYWLDLFKNGIDVIVKQAVSTEDTEDARARGENFKEQFVTKIQALKDSPNAFGELTIRSLLDMREQYLLAMSFSDPFLNIKQTEAEAAFQVLKDRLSFIDSVSGRAQQIELIEGLVAGNVFDWGAKESLKYLGDANFGLSEARGKIQKRPWLRDDLEQWLTRLEGPAHSSIVMFVDNGGVDVVLGVLPFVRHLLQRGSKVVLGANSYPAINDVTYTELLDICDRYGDICPIMKQGLLSGKLDVMETGSSSPCIDLRRIESSFAAAIATADLIILEGMGRAIVTNYNAKFTCESLRFAVLKNPWVAKRLGGEVFNVVFKYENINNGKQAM